MGLLEQIKKPNAKAFTHSGKFHADDVFSSALLLYLNPQITITRGNRVPEDYDGIVFILAEGGMIITRETVVCVKMEYRMPPLVCYGKNSEAKS